MEAFVSFDLQTFILRNPHLYHLTDAGNLIGIVADKRLMSAVAMIESLAPDSVGLLRTKREAHVQLSAGSRFYSIRDQRPISMKALAKCVSNDITPEQYLFLLNQHVFFWPSISRLERHYRRYQHEQPVIIRISTSALFERNPEKALFSRINSGATRANSYLGGVAPERGWHTFLMAEDYPSTISSVAEVTFKGECALPVAIEVGTSPTGLWQQVLL